MMKQMCRLAAIFLIAIIPTGWTNADDEDLRLLVLSEIEERLAGEMAFYSIEQNLAEQGCIIVKNSRVSAIGRQLARYSDRVHLRYSFYVIQGELAPQAFSLPGGHVFISQSMLDTVGSTDDEIAFILDTKSRILHYVTMPIIGLRIASRSLISKITSAEQSFY